MRGDCIVLGGKIKHQNDYNIKGKVTELIITRITGEKLKD